ncbi:MAG: S8 family peptidase, partial [Solirubrobacteraceae bacterium]|nr:S8 family peptidase [Solirubrobacteraceae bacterium]MDP4921751.1 S8 family peptidase [Solirubrobacteraceae bacterium]
MFASRIQGTKITCQRLTLALAVLCAGIVALAPAQAAAAGTSSDYIVLYESSAGLTQKVASEEARGNDVQDVFRSAVKGYVASLDSADVARLRAQDGVLLVEKDKPVEALSAGPRSGLASSWGLDRIDQRTLPLNSQISTSQNGFGVTAYIIDTGIRADHSQFGGRVAVGYDAIGDGQNTNDCNGHGTHVAGTVGGSSYGVAPQVSLVAIRVLDCGGSGSTSGVIAGINWATANHAAGVPAVANMSLGGGYSAALNTATQNAIADGITFAVAAGNENANACNSSPASTPNALTVGSTTSSDARSSFSNWGSCVDIFAPGSGITSAWSTSSTATNTISGTSMASPHVAGAAALLLSASPASTPAQVASAMGNAATTGVVNDAGTGSPNRLLYTGESSTPNPTPEPPPAPAPTPPANDNFA